ncbi:synaptotagmin-like protein 2 isoform X1 [Suncus etruscus]|uniref:synaptotagmin-like protein 2 isoform X1 n=2 Tax=Suncus etruscus TaxID=109475 RepID=UPI00210FFE89|nr:synaptotagmin-like protein 2 isoform X1 [Suncus etruscus]
MIDLSFLTEEEQEAIMKVLQRDASLKRKEEERVRHLPEKIKDDQQLKNMSGQWFYEAKAKRHRDRIHGTDIIRASMRKKRFQVTAEQSKDTANGAKERWVNNVNKNTLFPPEIAGVAEEPEEDTAPASSSSTTVHTASTMMDMPQENRKKSSVSPSKQRKNPFNSSELPEDHLSQQTKNEQSRNERAGFSPTSKEDELSKSKENSSVLDISSEKLEKTKQTFPVFENHSQIKAPVPRARKMINKSNDLKQDDNQPFPRLRTDSLNTKATPRGILKRNSSSSSTDSEIIRFPQNSEHKSKTVPPGLTIHERISEKGHSLEDDNSSNSPEPLKHVRFSSVKEELPQSPEIIHVQKGGEFNLFEADRLKNGNKDAEALKAFWNGLEPSQNRKPLHFHQSDTRPSASKNEAHQLPVHGHSSSSEVLTPRPQSVENLPTINEDRTKSPELLRPASELTQSPADELSHVEPESSQVPDHNAKEHQQGKPIILKGLKAKMSSHSDPFGSEIRKTVDDSISKVLDWFNRSTHSDDSKSSIQHSQETEPKEKDSELQTALLIDDTSLKECDSKLPSSTKNELTSMDSTLQIKRNISPSRNFQDNNVNIKSKPIKLFQQVKERSDILQSFEIYSSNKENKNMDNGQVSENIREESRVFFPSSNNSYINHKGHDAEDPYPCNIMDIGSLAEEEPKLYVYEKSRENLEVKFDSSTIAIEPSLKDTMTTEGSNKISVVPRNIELQSRTVNNLSPWKKPGLPLQETDEVTKSQVQREKYKRVSDRISFWEGETAFSKLNNKEKEPTSSHSQGQVSKAVKLQDMFRDSFSIDEGEYHQVTAKQVFLEEDDDDATHLSHFYTSDKPKEFSLQISDPVENFPLNEQSDKAAPFLNNANESIKTLPATDSLYSGKNSILPSFQLPSNIRSEIHTPVQKDMSLIGDSNTNFKVMSLKQRIDESNTDQCYNHVQFENLRKFWNLGANANNRGNVEKSNTTRTQKTETLSSQDHKEFNVIRSPGKNTHEAETSLHQRNVLTGEKIENSKCTNQMLPDESTFPLGPPIKSTHFLGNELSEEPLESNMEWLITPVLKEDNDYLDQEIHESIVKTSVSSKDYKDAFNDSLEKLLSETSLSSTRPGRGKQELASGVSENRTSPKNSDLAYTKEESIGPEEIIDEHVYKTVASPRVKPNTWTANLQKLLKEATGSSPSLSQINLDSTTTKINSEPDENRIFEDETEGNYNILAYQRKVKTIFPEGKKILGNTILPQKSESGECKKNMKKLFQMTEEDSYPLAPSSHLHNQCSSSNVPNSPQIMLSFQDTHLAPYKALTQQREISETIEKVVLPPKTTSNDINTALKNLLKEAWFSYPTVGEVDPAELKTEFPGPEQTIGHSPKSPELMAGEATKCDIIPDKKDFYSFNVVPIKSSTIGSHLPAQLSPSEQIFNPSNSTVAQCDKEFPQEVIEIVKETIIQPKSELLEFHAAIERLLKETNEISSSKHESHSGTLSPLEITGITKQVASEFHPEEIKETIKKSEVPSVTESAFDIGFEKLFKEISESPYQPQVSRKEETSKKRLSQSEQTRFLDILPHFYQIPNEVLEMKHKSNVLKSQVNKCDKVIDGDKGLTDLSVELSGSENGLDMPEATQFCMNFKTGTIETMNFSDHRDSIYEVQDIQEDTFLESGFKMITDAMNESRNRQPIPLLTDKENPRTSNIELFLASPYNRHEKEEEKEGFSDSDFSGGNIGSNAESWRTTSSSEEEPSPVLKALERSAARKMPSKSLEDISSDSSNQAKVDNLPEELVRSAEDDQKADQEPDTNECIPGISTVPSQPGNQFSHPDKLKRMSKSVPEFLQDESDGRETDTASESSYQLSRYKKSPGSLTNLSSSSGMTSLSSVSGSVMSVYSGDFGNLEVKGNIQFAIDYMDSLQELHVFVAQCKDLAAADIKKQRSDPYVKTYLLPDKGKMGKKKTLVVKKTLNPVYNEILRYKVEKKILKTQKLNLSVWHRDTFKRNSFLGEVELDLENWDWDNKENKQLKWYPLKRKTAPIALEAENRGEMKLALQYVPEPILDKKLSTTGEVHIWVKECIDLPQLRGSHLNSFVKCTILPDTSRKSRQKTRAVGKTTNPIFNHTMVYDGFRPEDLMEACVELTVWDHYKLTNQFLGGLRIGFGTGESYGTEVDWMDSTADEVALWEKMVNSPNTWVEATLPLRMLLIAKISK